MAGTLTITHQLHRTVQKLLLDWLSDASGDVSGTLTAVVSGILYRVAFVPDGGGTQPTDLYDVTIEDDDGVDVLAANGSNLSNATKSQHIDAGRAVDGKLELKVSNAGNAKGGLVALYVYVR
jgi:hypothetical protein